MVDENLNVEVKYYSVKIADVSGVLPFYKKETSDLSEDIKEQKRVREELIKFVSSLKKEFRETIVYVGEEKIEDKHFERFIFEKGGFMEIMLEPPLIMKAEFINKKDADKFVKALQISFNNIIPENPIKRIFIENIKVEDGNKNQLTVETWEKMHHIYIRKSITLSIVAITLVAFFNGLNEATQILSEKLLGYNSNVLTVFSAVVIAFAYNPVQKFIEKQVNKNMMR